jgi:hypothetical protein
MFMRRKNIKIIIISLFLIALTGCSTDYAFRGKNQPALDEPIAETAKPTKPTSDEPVEIAADAPGIESTSSAESITPIKPVEEKIKAVMLINGSKFESEINEGSSVYDLMSVLKMENKISFFGKNYADLGFFIEEINGIKNNPLDKNWVYYINGEPAKVGISFYQLKINDIIEWKYEKKSF